MHSNVLCRSWVVLHDPAALVFPWANRSVPAVLRPPPTKIMESQTPANFGGKPENLRSVVDSSAPHRRKFFIACTLFPRRGLLPCGHEVQGSRWVAAQLEPCHRPWQVPTPRPAGRDRPPARVHRLRLRHPMHQARRDSSNRTFYCRGSDQGWRRNLAGAGKLGCRAGPHRCRELPQPDLGPVPCLHHPPLTKTCSVPGMAASVSRLFKPCAGGHPRLAPAAQQLAGGRPADPLRARGRARL